MVHRSGAVVEKAQGAQLVFVAVVLEPLFHHFVRGYHIVGMHQPGYLLLGGELLPAHGAQVVYQGYHVGAAEMGHAADETEVFLDRILQHDDVAFTHQHAE